MKVCGPGASPCEHCPQVRWGRKFIGNIKLISIFCAVCIDGGGGNIKHKDIPITRSPHQRRAKISVFVILGSELSQVRCVREPGGKNLGKSFVCPISFDWILLTELSADDWHLISSVLAAACFVHSKFPTSCTRGRPPGDQGTAAGRSEGETVQSQFAVCTYKTCCGL